jgi:hypothetical protein
MKSYYDKKKERIQSEIHESLQLNDNYCDRLEDGLDEPNTSACSYFVKSYFICEGDSRKIPSSRVGDGMFTLIWLYFSIYRYIFLLQVTAIVVMEPMKSTLHFQLNARIVAQISQRLRRL